jgi:hypothetical protein
MRYVHLLYICLAATLLVVVGYAVIGDPALRKSVVSAAVLNAKGFAVIGSLMGMLRFDRGDYLRKAWAASLVYCLTLVEADIWVLLIGPRIGPDATGIGRGIIIVACNVFTVLSVWWFARAAAVSGLFMVSSRAERLLSMVPAAAVAFLIAGKPAWDDTMSLLAGDMGAIARVVSSVGDIASFILIAPLVTTVLKLRGSPLRWPFVYIAASIFCYLAFDLGDLVLRNTAAPPNLLTNIQDACRILACLFIFAAGVAQSVKMDLPKANVRPTRAAGAAA